MSKWTCWYACTLSCLFVLVACSTEAPKVKVVEQEAIIECLWCGDGPAPPAGQCQEYDCGGSSNVHYYTCCNNCDEEGPPPSTSGGAPDSPEYDGASDGNYCGACGANLGGGCSNGDPFSCGGTAGQTACKAWCDACAITFPGACWNWTDCFDDCCADGDSSDGVDGWICVGTQPSSPSGQCTPPSTGGGGSY